MLITANTSQPFRRLSFRQSYKRGLIAFTVLTLFTYVLFLFTRLVPDHVDLFEGDYVYDSILEPSSIVKSNLSKWERRQDEVRRAFRHAYSGYMEYAFPADELLATSGGNSSKFRTAST